MKITEFINNIDFLRIVKRYNSTNTEDLELKIASWDKVLNTDTFTIPILGVQGAGKSSLLNALLMDDIVLPVDSDETTCIPTEIIYSKDNNKTVDVLFLDEHIEKTPCSEEGLKKYVHQEDNPNNIKGVKCIKVYRNNKLLNNGVTFVDLPGVGSLSESNAKITMDYLENAMGAIFLLRTTPPITNSESVFIKLAWPLLSKVFFVQNQWNDETLEEVKDGKDHSLIVLKKIADQSKLHKFDVDIDVVNIYQSLTSKVSNNDKGVVKSGLPDLESKIINFIETWKTGVNESVKTNIIVLLEDTERTLLKVKESLTEDEEVLKKEYVESRVIFENELRASKEKYSEIKGLIRKSQQVLSAKIKSTVKISKEDFRNSIRTNLQKGNTDGAKLDKIYNDLKKEQVDIVFGTINPLIEDFIRDMQSDLGEITSFSMNNNLSKKETVGIEKNAKWESLLGKVGGSVGGVGGFAGGVAIAGTTTVTAASAKVGAAIGVGAGPAGVVAGIVIGAAIGAIGAFLFSKAGKEGENAVIKSRAEDAKKIIFPLIDNWSKELENNLQSQYSKLISELFNSIDGFYKKAETDFNVSDKKLKENLNKNKEQKRQEVRKVNEDLITLRSFYAKKELIHG